MRLARTVVIATCTTLAATQVAGAQGGLVDSAVRGFRRWNDSVDVQLHLRLNSSCLVNSDAHVASTSRCIVSDVPLPSPQLGPDTARVMPLQRFGSPFVRLGPPRTVANVDGVDSIPIIVGGWHGLVEAHHAPARRDVVFALGAEDDAGVARPATLTVRCRNGTLDVSLDVQQSFERVTARTVTVRLGSQMPQRQTWLRGREHTTLMVPGDQAHVRAFLDELGDHGRLTIDVAPSRTTPFSVFTFNLEGVPVVVTQLENACKDLARPGSN